MVSFGWICVPFCAMSGFQPFEWSTSICWLITSHFGWRYASIFVVAYVYVDVFWLSACLWVTIGFNPSAPACSLPQGLCWGLRSSNYKWVYLAIVRKVIALVIPIISKPSCTNYIVRWIPLYHPLSKHDIPVKWWNYYLFTPSRSK